MTIPVGALSAYLSVKGAQQARIDIQSVRTAMTEAGAAGDKAAVGLDRVDVALEGTAKASLSASTAANKLRASQLDQVAAVERYNKVLADENATIMALARAEAGLIRANERVSASTPVAAGFRGAATEANAAAAATSRFSGAMGSALGMAKSLGLLFGAVELVKTAIDMTKEANSFQKNMLLIQTNANATAGEVKDMSAALLHLAPQVGTGPVELAQALYHVEQNGLRGAAALEAVTVGAKGAKIGMADVEDTTNTLTIALASGITGMGSMSQAMGTMIAIAGTGDMRLKDLNEAMSGGILSVAKGYGATLGDVAAVLATLGDNGIRGADASTALRQTLMGFAAPAAKGAKALDMVGLSMTSLRDDMEQHGLVHAMNDLQQHMDAAGVTGAKVGGFITEAFGKKAGAGLSVLMGEIDRLNIKFDEGQKGAASFATKWEATTHTASFALDRLKAGFDAAGVAAAENLQPILATSATFLATELPKAINTVQTALKPLEHEVGILLPAAWHLFSGAVGIALDVLKPIGAVLLEIKGPLTDIAVVAGGAWLAFKGATLIVGLMETAALKVMYAKDAVFAFGATAKTTATEFLASSAIITEASDATTTAVVADGEAASIGWAGILGPIAAVGIGIGLLVSLFHKSSGASKEATDAAKAYTDALKTGSSTDLQDSIVSQLTKNNVPQKILDLNKALGGGGFVAKSFATAISQGGAPLAALRNELEAVAKAGTTVSVSAGRGASAVATFTPAAVTAKKLLKDLNAQYSALSKAAQKDLIDTKAFAGVSSSIDKVGQSTQVGSAAAKQYAQMMGIVVDKNGIAAVSSATLSKAVDTVSKSYDNATATGSQFLSALNTFSSSAGTAADRASLIGATLQAANGDALSYAAALTGTTSAIDAMTDAFKQQQQTLSSQSRDQKDALGAVVVAQARLNDVRKNAKASAGSLAAAEHALAKAQEKAGQSGALAYADTERAAIKFKGVGKDLTASIDTTAKGAGDLVSQLQAIQTAAMGAASATYQHEVATKGAKKAADDAYNIYVGKTQGALVAEAKQLGITVPQAEALAKAYFGMPKDVKTKIESEGTDPILTVLNKIGELLAKFTGEPWDITVTANVNPALTELGKLEHGLKNLSTQGAANLTKIAAGMTSGRGYASGTDSSLPGWAWVGEDGPELMKLPAGAQIKPAGVSKQITNNTAPKTVNLTQNNYYPEPEKPIEALPHTMRRAAIALDGF